MTWELVAFVIKISAFVVAAALWVCSMRSLWNAAATFDMGDLKRGFGHLMSAICLALLTVNLGYVAGMLR